MAHPDHLTCLRQGVAAWNWWLQEQLADNPNFRADLSGLDFTKANWTDTTLWDADKRRVDLSRCLLTQTDLRACNLSGANLHEADLTGADLSGADLTGANLCDADLSETRMREADITGATLTYACLRLTDMRNVEYKRALLAGKCVHLRGAADIQSNALLRRNLLDQDYIDSTYAVWRRSFRKGTGFGRYFAFADPRNVPFYFIGTLLALWYLFDYGRGWFRVGLFGVICVLALGFAYQWAVPAGHVVYLDNVGTESAIRPWFVAVMGFSTLGLSDLLAPQTTFGSVLMMANVLLGFLTLGLLLSTLGNVFARRAD